MTFNFHPITAVYLLGLVISLVLTMIILKRRPSPGAGTFAILNLVAAWWILTCILEYGAVDLASKILWAKLQALSVFSSGVVWLIFALNYTGHTRWTRARYLALMSLFPLITWGIVLTNQWHGLYWSRIYLTDTHFGLTGVWEHGPWFWSSVAYQYILDVSGIIFLVRYNRDKSLLHRKQLAVLILGATAPVAVNLIYYCQIKALEGLDFTSLSLSLSGIFYSLLIFRFHFLDVNTLARNSIVEQIPEGILVLNQDGNISDMNPAAEKILGYDHSMLHNQQIDQIWPELSGLKSDIPSSEHKTAICQFGKRSCYLDLSLTTMTDKRGTKAGELLILRDVTDEKVAEDRLKQSEEKFSRVFQSSPGAIVIATLDGRIVKVNQKCLDITNYSEAELIGKNILENVKLQTTNIDSQTPSGLKLEKPLNNVQIKIASRSGVMHALLCSVTTVTINNETLALISASDITELNQAHEAIKRKIEIEQSVTRISSRFVGTFDYRGSITSALGDIGNLCRASRTYLFLIDREHNQMSNTHEWCAPNVEPELANLQNLSCEAFPWWMSKLRQGQVINVPLVDELPDEAAAEKEILSSQGIKSLLVFPLTLKGVLAGYIGLDDVLGAVKWSDEDVAVLRTAVEIIGSALQRLQADAILESQNAELVESEEYQRKLLSSLQTGVMTVDAQTHRIVDINEYGCRLFGAAREEIVGHRCHQFICQGQTDQCPAMTLRQQVASSERVVLKTDGTKQSVIKSVFKIRHGNHDYLIESITDIEPLKQAQAALRESEQRYKFLYEQEKTESAELEQESQARGNFISVLTHELKTPLTPLLASIDMLSQRFQEDQTSVEARLIKSATAGVNVLNNRLNELLDLAKMSNGTYQFDYQAVETEDFFKAVARRFESEFQKRNQLLIAYVEPALPAIRIDPARLERALAYLLNSAGRSSEKGDPVVLKARVDSHQLLIDIEDRAASLSTDEKQRLFEPYHRVEQDRQKFSGLGLGFAITKQIIDAHGGWIELKSGEKCGNKFLIGIPLANLPEKEPD